MPLDPKITKGGRGGTAFLVAGVRQGRRVSLRRIQFVFREWQGAAGFESMYPFHALRHTAITTGEGVAVIGMKGVSASDNRGLRNHDPNFRERPCEVVRGRSVKGDPLG